MSIRSWITTVMLAAALGLAGCNSLTESTNGAALAPLVDAKAADVAAQIGGSDGFGGMSMEGYFAHAAGGMGFADAGDLADPNSTMMLTLQNGSSQDCTVHLAYITSSLGLTQQTRDVEVAAGDEVTVEMPCAEIMGMGSVDRPGATACHLADGQALDNTMTVPGFLGLDYDCGDVYRFMLTPDTEDLDGDGDTSELIVSSDAMRMHLEDGGPSGHMHGSGGGMMGMHAGG